MQTEFENGVLTLHLTGHVDAANAPAFEAEIRKTREEYPADMIVLDCEQLDYMSSAGLRIVLRLKQNVNHLSLINVHPAFYEVLDTTGFTEMMEIKKAYRLVSLKDCELIGQGANGKIYRLDRENIIKVYTNTDALPEIHHDRDLSRAAFVMGVPTAIPYDVVQIEEGGYGAVYELLNAQTYIQLLKSGEKSMDELVQMSVGMLRLIHSRIVKQSFVPGIKDTAFIWTRFLKDHLPAEVYEKLYALIDAVPDDMHMVHGDFHFRNIMYQDGESLLIDMDKLSHGHPVFELAAIYMAYRGFGAADHSETERFLGISYETSTVLWQKFLEQYLEITDKNVLQAVEDKARIISSARIMQHYIRRNGLETEEGRRQIAYAQAVLEDLLPRVDTLLF